MSGPEWTVHRESESRADRRSGPDVVSTHIHSLVNFSYQPPGPDILSVPDDFVHGPPSPVRTSLVYTIWSMFSERVYRLHEECFKIFRYLGSISHKDQIISTAGHFFKALREKTYKNKDGVRYEQSEFRVKNIKRECVFPMVIWSV